MTKEDYAKKAYQWAKALKLLDPSITLVLCGESGTSYWDSYVLKECFIVDQHALGGSSTKVLIELHSIHQYTTSDDPIKNAFASRLAERAVEVCASLIDLARLQNNVPPSVPRQQICFDEWNVWDPARAVGEKGAEEQYNLSDALAVAIWLNAFIRQSKYVGMANLAQSVNVISPLMTSKNGLVKQTTWWPLLLFNKYMRGYTIATHTSCPCYERETEPAWLRNAGDTPWLDVSATIDDSGGVNLVVVNVSPFQSFELELDGMQQDDRSVEAYTVTGDCWDATNTADEEMVGLKSNTFEKLHTYTFPNMSMTMLHWKGA